MQTAQIRLTEPAGAPYDGLEHGLHVGGRAGDHAGRISAVAVCCSSASAERRCRAGFEFREQRTFS